MYIPTLRSPKRKLLMASGWQRRGACGWRALFERGVTVTGICTWALLILGLVVAFTNSDFRVRPDSWSNLGTGQQNLAKVGSYQRRAVTLLQSSLGTEAISTTDGLLDLAGLYQRQERYAEAESLCDRALIILMYHLGTDSPQVTEALNRLAELHRHQGNTAMVIAVSEFARSISEPASGGDSPLPLG